MPIMADHPMRLLAPYLELNRARGQTDGAEAKLAAYLLGSGDELDEIWGVDVAKGQRLPLVLVPTALAISLVWTGEVLLLTLPLILIFMVFQRAFVRGVTLTGMKE